MGDKPDQQPLIMAHPELGVTGYWLTPEGLEHVRQIESRKPKRPPVTRYSDAHAIFFFPGIHRLLREESLTSVDFRVLLAVIVTSNHEEDAWRSDITKLCRLSRAKPQSVQRSLKKLTDIGILHRPRRGYLAFDHRTLWRNGAASRELAKRRENTE